MFFPKSLHEIVFRGENRVCNNKDHEDFAGFFADTDKNMPEETETGNFIVDSELKGRNQSADTANDFARLFILNLAVRDWDVRERTAWTLFR